MEHHETQAFQPQDDANAGMYPYSEGVTLSAATASELHPPAPQPDASMGNSGMIQSISAAPHDITLLAFNAQLPTRSYTYPAANDDLEDLDQYLLRVVPLVSDGQFQQLIDNIFAKYHVFLTFEDICVRYRSAYFAARWTAFWTAEMWEDKDTLAMEEAVQLEAHDFWARVGRRMKDSGCKGWPPYEVMMRWSQSHGKAPVPPL